MTSVRDHETISDDLVRTENLTVAFGKVVALNGVNFRVGGGKSSVCSATMALERPRLSRR